MVECIHMDKLCGYTTSCASPLCTVKWESSLPWLAPCVGAPEQLFCVKCGRVQYCSAVCRDRDHKRHISDCKLFTRFQAWLRNDTNDLRLLPIGRGKQAGYLFFDDGLAENADECWCSMEYVKRILTLPRFKGRMVNAAVGATMLAHGSNDAVQFVLENCESLGMNRSGIEFSLRMRRRKDASDGPAELKHDPVALRLSNLSNADSGVSKCVGNPKFDESVWSSSRVVGAMAMARVLQDDDMGNEESYELNRACLLKSSLMDKAKKELDEENLKPEEEAQLWDRLIASHEPTRRVQEMFKQKGIEMPHKKQLIVQEAQLMLVKAMLPHLRGLAVDAVKAVSLIRSGSPDEKDWMFKNRYIFGLHACDLSEVRCFLTEHEEKASKITRHRQQAVATYLPTKAGSPEVVQVILQCVRDILLILEAHRHYCGRDNSPTLKSFDVFQHMAKLLDGCAPIQRADAVNHVYEATNMFEQVLAAAAHPFPNMFFTFDALRLVYTFANGSILIQKVVLNQAPTALLDNCARALRWENKNAYMTVLCLLRTFETFPTRLIHMMARCPGVIRAIVQILVLHADDEEVSQASHDPLPKALGGLISIAQATLSADASEKQSVRKVLLDDAWPVVQIFLRRSAYPAKWFQSKRIDLNGLLSPQSDYLNSKVDECFMHSVILAAYNFILAGVVRKLDDTLSVALMTLMSDTRLSNTFQQMIERCFEMIADKAICQQGRDAEVSVIHENIREELASIAYSKCARVSCGNFEDSNSQFKSCQRCRLRYCSKECQEKSWATHKEWCKHLNKRDTQSEDASMFHPVADLRPSGTFQESLDLGKELFVQSHFEDSCFYFLKAACLTTVSAAQVLALREATMSFFRIPYFENGAMCSTRAINIDPSCGDSWVMRATAHEKCGRIQEAIHDLKQALELKMTLFRHGNVRADIMRLVKSL